MTRQAYRNVVRSFAGRRIVVVGDVMLDEYLFGRASRVSPEAPVMVVDVESEGSVPGGAANVACNLLALGASVAIVGVVGDDEAGRSLASMLAERGADVTGLVVDGDRPTTRKTRILAQSQQVLRVDREQTGVLGGGVSASLLDQVAARLADSEAVLISDYAKGVVHRELAERVVEEAHGAGKLVTANPKPANAAALRGADVVSFNESEAAAALQLLGLSRTATSSREGGEGIDRTGGALAAELGVRHLVVTQGSRGLSLWSADGTVRRIPARPVAVYDVAGAGDTVIAALTLGLAGGAEAHLAALVANHAASCVVRKVGVATVTADELLVDW